MQKNKTNEDKKCIALAVNSLAIGGVEKLAIDQLKTLDREKFKIHLISLMQFPGRNDFYDLVPKDVEVHKLHFGGFYDIAEWLKLFSLIARIKPDLVKSALFFSNSIFALLKPFFRYVFIGAEHNTKMDKNVFQRILNKFVRKVSFTTVVDSQAVRDFLIKTEGAEKDSCTVIYNSIDLEETNNALSKLGAKKEEIRNKIGVGLHDKVFLNIARVVEQKNHKLMIDGFKKLSDNYKDVKLVIAGDGVLVSEIKKQISELGLENSVILLGETKDLLPLYVASDFFIMTSLHEGFSIVSMQALSFGLPLVSTRVAGIEEYLRDGENGFFVEGNEESVFEGMEKVLSLPDERLKSFETEARKTSEDYSLSAFRDTYNKLFSQALSS